DDELRPDRRLLELARPPAVRFREAAVRGVLEQRQHALRDLGAAAGGDRARADVVETAVVAIEAEEQRRDRLATAFPAHAGDDAVGGLVLLHLDDAVARAGQIRGVQSLRDDAVEPERLEAVEPAASLVDTASCRRNFEHKARSALLELAPPFLEGPAPDVVAVPEEDVEDD